MLNYVQCASASACMVVGSYYDNTADEVLPLVLPWSGSNNWGTPQAAPLPSGASTGALYGVSCPSTTACIAVGEYQITSNSAELPLAEVWNGSSWSATPNQPSDPPAAAAAWLNAVWCWSGTSCTAVGTYDVMGGGSSTLAETWNGTSWSAPEATNNPTGSQYNGFVNLSCNRSAAGPPGAPCQAVGFSANGPLVESWDGTNWSMPQSTNSPTNATLSDVSCTAGNACTAVGYYTDNSFGATYTLAERWDGTSWSSQTTPNAALFAVGNATNVGSASATLTGTVYPEGATVSTCYFKYGTTTAYGSVAQCAQAVGGGDSPVSVSADLSGLAPNTTYYFDLVAANAAGGVDGGLPYACYYGCQSGSSFTTTAGGTPAGTTGSGSTTTTPRCSTGPGGTLTGCAVEQTVFVHGINASCANAGAQPNGTSGVGDYRALYDTLAGQGLGVYTFCYSDDLAFANHPSWQGRCFSDTSRGESGIIGATAGTARTTSPNHIGPLYLSSNRPGTSPSNDGDDALAVEAAKLDDCLNQLVSYDIQTYGAPLPIAVIGNSMGGAITRGWLALAKWRSSRALTAVTTVFFLEGATEGSWIAAVGEGADAGIAGIPLIGSDLDSKARSLAQSHNLNPGRPGVQDLAPDSAYYQSIVNNGPPPHLHYFALSADIFIHLEEQVLWWTTEVARTDAIGDGVIALGSQNANTLPAWGGSQFLPFGAAADEHQYLITRDYYETFNPLVPLATSLSNPYSDPYNHFNFGTYMGKENAHQQFTGGLTVPSCDRSDGTLSIPGEILRVLEDPAQACSSGPAQDVGTHAPPPMAADAPAEVARAVTPASSAGGGGGSQPVVFRDRGGRGWLALYTSAGPQQGRLTIELGGRTMLAALPARLVRKRVVTLNLLLDATSLSSRGSSVRLRLHGVLKPGSHYARLTIRSARPRLSVTISSPTPNIGAAKLATSGLMRLLTRGDVSGLVQMLSPTLVQGVSRASIASRLRAQRIHVRSIRARGPGRTLWLMDGDPGWVQPVIAVARGRPTLRASLVFEQLNGRWRLLGSTG